MGESIKTPILLFALAALGACNQSSVRVLHEQQTPAQSPGNSARTQQVVGPFDTDALIYATAFGQSQYRGNSDSAGIQVLINDGQREVMADSFEGQASTVNFAGSVSRVIYLPSGQQRTIVGATRPYGSGSQRNTQTAVQLDVVAVSARR